jgi:L-rhamnose-H+ transport protein
MVSSILFLWHGRKQIGKWSPAHGYFTMAFIILVANMWGIILKEWKGVSKKTARTIAVGILTIILAVGDCWYWK